jgi:hypothetical protein
MSLRLCLTTETYIQTLHMKFRIVQIMNICTHLVQGYSKRSIHFQKCILQKLLTLNPCPVYEWKGNLSKFWFEPPPGARCARNDCLPRGVMYSVGRAGLSIWHLPRHTWSSHRVLARCEHNFESPPVSLYVARHHMFNNTCKINFWKCILLFYYPAQQFCSVSY